MQRATYLAHLYESVSSIPPDIQSCLLTIAQYGCDPDQVKRWYTIVRHHFGVGEPESPVSALPQESMPPPPQRPVDTPTRSRSSTSSQISPASYHDPLVPMTTEAMMTVDALGIQQGLPQQMVPNPWMTPAVSDSGFESASSGFSRGQPSSAPAIGGLFGLSPSFETGGMPFFTGSGLVQVPDGGEADFSVGALPPRPSPYDFTMSSAAMPVFVKFEADPSPTASRGNTTSTMNVSPSKTLRSSMPLEPAQKRSRMTLRQNQTIPRVTAPMPRPRRPSMPFRASDNSTLYMEPAQMPQTPSGTSQPSSYTNPVDLTQPSPSFSEPGLRSQQPGPDAKFLHSPEQRFHTPYPQQHRQAMQTPEQQQVPQLSRQNSQQQLTYAVTPRSQQQPSPYLQQQIEQSSSHYLAAASQPSPYKSPYA